MIATLKTVSYDTMAKQVKCLVSFEVQGVVSEVTITVNDDDLEALKSDWWLPECCTACAQVLGFEVRPT